MNATRQTRTGFTLLEMLVTVAIIAILVSLMLPSLAGVRRTAAKVECLAHLRDLSIAATIYASDYGVMPCNQPLGTLGRVAPLDVSDKQWVCRADRTRGAATQGSSYSYLAPLYMVESGHTFADIAALRPWVAVRAYQRNPELPLFRDVWEFHGHRNTAFYDGRVVSSPPEAR